MSFTVNGQRFETVTIARLVILLGWTHVPAGDRGACSWLIEDHYRDADGWPEVQVVECGAEIAYSDDQWVCAAGHEHTSMEARERAGWDYAADAYDAAVISRGGRTPVPAGPNTYIDPTEVAHVLAALS